MSTIAAISTSPGTGGIGIIRISGEKTFDIIERIFKQKKHMNIDDIKGYTIKYGNIINPYTNEIIDEVLVSYFKKPYSYTTENMCEINSHGGVVVMKKILNLCIENGANIAQPGEFTKRAFLNGRIDLTQAESIIDIINSKTEKEAKASVKQLKGFLSSEIGKIRNKIMDLLTDIEANIDYPEYDIEDINNKKILQILDKIEEELKRLKDSFKEGKIIRDGIKVAIIGKPNVGKSSLLNAILKEDRAIVTEIEGTTRDSIEEFIEIRGIPVKIIDTAGIRDARDEVEKIGIKKSKEIADEADIVISIFDGSKQLDDQDKEILSIIKDKIAIIVINKKDLTQNKDTLRKIESCGKETIYISALTRDGVEEVNNKIAEIFNLDKINIDNEGVITSIRHKNLINDAIKNTIEARKTLESGMPVDIVSINIKNILESLGEITGENVSEEIINEIFSKFCLGK